MTKFLFGITLTLAMAWPQMAIACDSLSSTDYFCTTEANGELRLAQNKRKRGAQPRHLRGEKVYRPGDRNEINFGDQRIGGTTRGPGGTVITTPTKNRDYDFVKIRLRWHPEMIRSASNLE